MKHKNCLVAQSGGPTTAINASLAGVLSGVMRSGIFEICYGALNGILGILNENYVNLSAQFAKDEDFRRLAVTPAMHLGSCRHKLPDYKDDDSPYVFIFRQFDLLGIAAFFYIGGNDSMDTVLKLSDYAKRVHSDVRIIGIPKTIDNDLCCIDHTPGFGSAAKFIAGTMLEIAHDTYIYPVKSVTIVEIMGRDAGWLTAASALARSADSPAPHLIYLPEAAFTVTQFLSDVRQRLETHDHVVIAVSEGIRDESGTYLAASESACDQFGHRQLSGAGKSLEFLVKEKLGIKVRSVEINVLQRCAGHLASKTDLSESFSLGQKAVALAEDGIRASMITLQRTCNEPYTVSYSHAPIAGIANETKTVPREWINEEGNDILPALYEYLLPLIQGEIAISYRNGIPDYMPVAQAKPQK